MCGAHPGFFLGWWCDSGTSPCSFWSHSMPVVWSRNCHINGGPLVLHALAPVFFLRTSRQTHLRSSFVLPRVWIRCSSEATVTCCLISRVWIWASSVWICCSSEATVTCCLTRVWIWASSVWICCSSEASPSRSLSSIVMCLDDMMIKLSGVALRAGYSLFPIPYSLFPIPYSLFPIPYSLLLASSCLRLLDA